MHETRGSGVSRRVSPETPDALRRMQGRRQDCRRVDRPQASWRLQGRTTVESASRRSPRSSVSACRVASKLQRRARRADLDVPERDLGKPCPAGRDPRPACLRGASGGQSDHRLDEQDDCARRPRRGANRRPDRGQDGHGARPARAHRTPRRRSRSNTWVAAKRPLGHSMHGVDEAIAHQPKAEMAFGDGHTEPR